MGGFVRLLLGTPLAAFVTVVLFLVMFWLITNDPPKLEEDGDTINININRKLVDKPISKNRQEFERPKLDQPPPPPPAVDVDIFELTEYVSSVEVEGIVSPPVETRAAESFAHLTQMMVAP